MLTQALSEVSQFFAQAAGGACPRAREEITRRWAVEKECVVPGVMILLDVISVVLV